MCQWLVQLSGRSVYVVARQRPAVGYPHITTGIGQLLVFARKAGPAWQFVSAPDWHPAGGLTVALGHIPHPQPHPEALRYAVHGLIVCHDAGHCLPNFRVTTGQYCCLHCSSFSKPVLLLLLVVSRRLSYQCQPSAHYPICQTSN